MIQRTAQSHIEKEPIILCGAPRISFFSGQKWFYHFPLLTKDEAKSLLLSHMKNTPWVAEGVFGDLLNHLLHEVDTLVWLTPEISICLAQLQSRDSSPTHDLIEWASTYFTRAGVTSHRYHKSLYDSFEGDKTMLANREAISAFLNPHNKPL